MTKTLPIHNLKAIQAMIKDGKLAISSDELSYAAANGLNFDDIANLILALDAQDFCGNILSGVVWQDIYIQHITLRLAVENDKVLVFFKEQA